MKSTTSADIITVCTYNYRRGLEFTLESWLKCSTIGHIFLLTDTLTLSNPKITCLKVLPESDDWVRNVGYKPLALLRYLESFLNSPRYAFLDADVLIVDSFDEIWDRDFDVAVTRLYDSLVTRPVYAPQYPASVSAGALFFKRGPRATEFIERWSVLQEHYLKEGRLRECGWCYDQLALQELCVNDVLGENKFRILDIDNTVFNSEHHLEASWITSIILKQPKMLHFKRQRWEDKALVEKVLRASQRLHRIK